MGRLAASLRSLAPDIWSALAAAACIIPVAGALPHHALNYAPELGALDLIASVLTLPGIIMLAYPQILMAVVVRKIRNRLARATGVIASTGLGIWYAVWAVGADLSGSSTAPLALMFFQVMIQGWAWLAAFALVLILEVSIRKVRAGRRKAEERT
jgi:hypothetical protein